MSEKFSTVQDGVADVASDVEAPPGAPARASVDSIAVRVRGAITQPEPAVSLETSAGIVTLTTTRELAELAQTLVDMADVVATIVQGSAGRRLLSLRTTDEQDARRRVPPVEETLDRFDGVLRILAR